MVNESSNTEDATSHKHHPHEVTAAQPEAPAPVEVKAEAAPTEKVSKLKMALLYTLIGGLAAAALVAIVSLLIGDFTSAAQRALGTIFIFVLHSLFILGLVWADKQDELGKSIIPTTIMGVAFANIITMTLSTWDLIDSEVAWRACFFYALAIGVSFIVAGLLRFRVHAKPVMYLFNATAITIGLWAATLVPWIFDVVDWFDPLYYRIIGALTILATTTFLIGFILRSIATSKSQELKAEALAAARTQTPGALLAYYIPIGVITIFVWMGGVGNFISDASNDASYFEHRDSQRY